METGIDALLGVGHKGWAVITARVGQREYIRGTHLMGHENIFTNLGGQIEYFLRK